MSATSAANRTAKRQSQSFSEPAVKAAFDGHPPAIKARLMALRQLIFATAASIDGVGPLEETLKWKQPSYLTTVSGSGSTIRIDRIKDTNSTALYFNCKSNLVETFRSLYPHDFNYGGNRSIILDSGDEFPETALRHCIGLALTYHRSKLRPRA
jgi:hypothetical protein